MILKKILIADDVAYSLEIGKGALTRSGCEVLTATNGREALEKTREFRPDLVVLDLHMPEMNGDDCCRAIKSDPELAHIPVIMVTTAGVAEDKTKCIDAGCDDFIFKPFKVPDLLDMAARHVKITFRTRKREETSGEIRYCFEGPCFDGRLQDLSAEGLRVRCSRLLPIGSVIEMTFRLPGLPEAIEVTGEVVRHVGKGASLNSSASPGMGVRFVDPSEEVLESVSLYLESC